MFQPTAIKSISAVSAAFLVAGLVVFFPPGVPEAMAEAQTPTLHQTFETLGKSDRLPLFVKSSSCGTQNWPYLEQSCQFDLRQPADAARTVRVIALR